MDSLSRVVRERHRFLLGRRRAAGRSLRAAPLRNRRRRNGERDQNHDDGRQLREAVYQFFHCALLSPLKLLNCLGRVPAKPLSNAYATGALKLEDRSLAASSHTQVST